MTDIVLSRDATVWHQPAGSPRRYLLSPLTWRERAALRRDVAEAGATYPGDEALFAALRAALREIGPSNLAELLPMVDAAEEEMAAAAAGTPAGPAVTALRPVEAAALAVPAYAAVVAARTYWLATYPVLFARRALRGWEGPDLPPFTARRGMVDDAALDALPEGDLVDVGWRATALTFVTQAAEKNSVPPLQ